MGKKFLVKFRSDGYFISTVSKYGNEEVISNYVKSQGVEKEYKRIDKKQLELFEYFKQQS
jgi:hypothetical protein